MEFRRPFQIAAGSRKSAFTKGKTCGKTRPAPPASARRAAGEKPSCGELLNDLRSRGTACAELNLMDIASLDDFIAKFARAVYRELAPVSDALNQVAGLFKRITPTVGIDNAGKPELKFTITSAKAGIEALRDVLELPTKLCTKGKRMVAESTIEHDTGAYRLANPLLSHHLAQQA